MAGKRAWANLIAGVAFALAIILIIWYAAVLFSAIARSQTYNSGIPFEWRVVDGDTISTRPRPRKYYRLVGFDTPEITRPRCDAELLKGYEAKRYLEALLASGPLVWFDTGNVDRYGRSLVYIWIGGHQIKDLMVRAKLGVESNGKSKFNWCQYLKTKH